MVKIFLRNFLTSDNLPARTPVYNRPYVFWQSKYTSKKLHKYSYQQYISITVIFDDQQISASLIFVYNNVYYIEDINYIFIEN